MPTMRDIKHRITSVESTQQITRAMKMVAGARLRRAQQRLAAVRPYAHEIAFLLRRLLPELDYRDLPLLAPPNPEAAAAVVLFTADRGLCGSFNSNLFRAALLRIETLKREGRGILLVTVGKRGARFFERTYRRRKDKGVVHEDWPGLYDTSSMAGFVRLAERLEGEVAEGRLSSASIIFSLFHSVVRQRPVERTLIPVQEDVLEDAREGGETQEEWLPLVEPDPVTTVREAMKRFLAAGLYRALVENWTSEMGARMTAMDAATNNAEELIGSLTLDYNKARQAAITKEIVDITGGAEALKQVE